MFFETNRMFANVDLETNGITPEAPITAAALAVPLASRSIVLWASTIAAQGQSHRVADQEALRKWEEWKLQDPRLIDIMRAPSVHLSALYSRLRSLAQIPGMTLWSHGSAFDIPILKSAAPIAGISYPFHYRAALDSRTALALAPYANLATPPDWVVHSALHDVLLDTVRLIAIDYPRDIRQMHVMLHEPSVQATLLKYATKQHLSEKDRLWSDNAPGELILSLTGKITPVYIDWSRWIALSKTHPRPLRTVTEIPLRDGGIFRTL